MKDLIKALQIFAKYEKDDCIYCEHDVMYVCISPDKVLATDGLTLQTLGFHIDLEEDNFYSYRFGSC
jgi:hypothetical protein